MTDQPTRPLTVGSLFAGIGGFDLGFERAGFVSAWRCETESFCRDVLTAKLPGPSIYGDVRALSRTVADHVDVLTGGFPCQDVSVAGQRKGLNGARSGLFFDFVRLIGELQPAWVVIENVPGLLSSHNGRDFAVVLHALAERGYGWAYGVLDSRYFRVPQRRRRVFIVGCLGGQYERAAQVLFEPESGEWDSATSNEAGPDVAACLRGRSARAGVNEPGRGGEDDMNLICFEWQSGGDVRHTYSSSSSSSLHASQTPAVFATLNSGGNNGGFRTEPGEHLIVPERERALVGSMHKRHDDDTDTLIPTLTGNLGHHGYGSDRGDGAGLIAATLQGNSGRNHVEQEYLPVAFALRASSGGIGQGHNTTFPGGVRRLTPLECERLQGFPDGWTCLCGEGHRGSAFCRCKDTPRYKALGNAVTVPVAEWIAQRIKEAEGLA